MARKQLGKPDTASLDSQEKTDEYIAKLSERSIDSLRDSLADLNLELNELDTDGEAFDPTAQKVEDPTVQGRDNAQPKSEPKEVDAVDSLFN